MGRRRKEPIVAERWPEGTPNPIRNTNHTYLKFINSTVFSEEARHFLRYGYYTSAPYGSKDWTEYWDEQERRCREGYSVGGVRISGRHYFFLNFTLIRARPIDLITGLEKEGAKKIITFPRFLDHQYYLGLELEECFAEGPHRGKSLQGIAIAKSRRKGLTFFNSGGIINYNFNFIPTSHTVIASYEAVHYGTLLNGTHFGLNHINKNTDWAKRRQKINRRDHFRASFVYTNELGVEAEDGFMSEVQAKSFKDDPFKTIGDSIDCMCFEEAGKFKGLLDAYTIAEPTFRDGDIMTGVPLIWGTGGNVEAGGKDLEELFYDPSPYGLKTYENIYDENATGDCGWFIDDLWYLPGVHKSKHLLVDAQGNSYRQLTEDSLDAKRKLRERGSRVAYRRFITQQPKCVSAHTLVSYEKGTKEISTIRDKIENGYADLYEVVTENNRRLECTLNHHIYNGNEYKELSKFRAGDKVKLFPYSFGKEYQTVRVGTDLPIMSSDIIIDEELAWFIGLYMGDGHFSGKHFQYELGMSFDKRDKESINKYLKLTDRFFGKTAKPEIMGKKDGGVRIRITSKSLRFFMMGLNLVYYSQTQERLKRDVDVPYYIMASPKSVVAAFLNGVFDSDGGIYNSVKRIGIASKHERFLERVSLLLSGFGVYTTNKVSNKTNREGRTFLQRSLFIDAFYVNTFAEEIRFTSKRKNEVLDKYASYQTKLRIDRSFDVIKSIKFTRNDLTYNLTTECGYYGANGIWTHNSPREAFLRISSSPFDGLRAQMRLNTILTNRSTYLDSIYISKLTVEPESGVVTYEYDPTGIPLREYPIKDWNYVEGCLEIYEHPVRGGDDRVFPLRYIAGIDSYDADESTTDSLGSIQILDRLTDRIVAHFKGRPTANQFYETCRRMLKYYSATANYERSNKGIYGYFYNKHCLHLLCDEPKILKEKGISKANTAGNNAKGTAPHEIVNAWGRELAQTWMDSRAYGEDEGSEIVNMDKIRSLGLLREIISYNQHDNFDDISSLGMLMIYREDLMVVKVRQDSVQKSILNDPFFKRHSPGNEQFRARDMRVPIKKL